MEIIDIQNASVYRGANRVFSGLTLRIARGGQTAILGPNGAGKSTLLQLLSGSIRASYSEESVVRLFGLASWDAWTRRARLGIVSHDLQRDYHDGVRGDEVILSGYYSSVGLYPYQSFSAAQRKRAEGLMEMLGVAALRERRFFEMSTGEQRRFLLGRALVHDPELLVLDEPTGGLDLRASFQYLGIIRNLIREGKTILLVTHHLDEIPPEVERVILLKEGRVVADGKKAELLTSGCLSDLFDVPVRLVEADGWYQALPGR